VAIKVLPAHVAGDPERKQRFEREAKTLAALSHPHICPVFDIGQQDGVDFLVMEYLEGETLAQRLIKGALPLDQALDYAIQIVDALDKAHRKGIVHRDLKPANVMLTKQGVKLLDFGLAKVQPAGAVAGMSAAATVSGPLTGQGAILGTLHYMAPEQVEGKDADARSDIFAFGAIVHEMATGQRAFQGKSAASVMAAILDREPPKMSSLQPLTPPALDHVVSQCLEKDPEQRWQTAGDVMRELKWTADVSSQANVRGLEAAPRVTRERLAWMIAARRATLAIAVALVAGSLVTGVAVWNLKPQGPQQVVRVTVTPRVGEPLLVVTGRNCTPPCPFEFPDVAISPDGRRIVYSGGASTRRDQDRTAADAQLVVRLIDQLQATPLPGLSRAPFGPFVSPDGAWIGFNDLADGTLGGTLKKVSMLGGPPVTICSLSAPLRGASWGADDSIIFGTADPATGLLRVPAGGGEPEPLTKPDSQKGEADHYWPEILPGGRAILFTTVASAAENYQIAVLNLETRERKTLIPGGSNPKFTSTGHIVYGVAGTLRAVAFDADHLEVLSDPVPVLDSVVTKVNGAVNFSVARDGSLVYVAGTAAGETPRRLMWVDRQGREEATNAPSRAYTYPRISPDATKVALDIRDQENDIWIWDVARETLTRLTFDPGGDEFPLWTPDGRRIAFSSPQAGAAPNLFWRAADGTGSLERLTESPNQQVPTSFSPDGTRLLFREITSGTGADIGILPLDGERRATPLVQTSFSERNADVSPDGRWIAYESNESGQFEIYIRPFPQVDAGRWQVSAGGGTRPLWARNGRELFYLVEPGRLMAVPIQPGSTFAAGNPQVVFEGQYGPPLQRNGRTYDVSPDGQRFLMIKEGAAGETSVPQLVVVLNWFEELKRLVPTK
jgi:serine/threonine-protein kinase